MGKSNNKSDSFFGSLVIIGTIFLYNSCSDDVEKVNYLEQELKSNPSLTIKSVAFGDDELMYCGNKVYAFDEDEDESYYSDSIPNKVKSGIEAIDRSFDNLLKVTTELPIDTPDDRVKNLNNYKSLACIRPTNELVQSKVEKYTKLVKQDKESEDAKSQWMSQCHSFMEKYTNEIEFEENYTARFLFNEELKENNIYVSNISYVSESGIRQIGSFHCKGDDSFNVTEFTTIGRYIFTVENRKVVKRFDFLSGESTKYE
ncbi:hypothetical protein EYS14_14760 [Alteromonadaceae bacterium M269]|nr:hypothetical protein EYS14_14760 [Alteromonadaceae bacterium M269]